MKLNHPSLLLAAQARSELFTKEISISTSDELAGGPRTYGGVSESGFSLCPFVHASYPFHFSPIHLFRLLLGYLGHHIHTLWLQLTGTVGKAPIHLIPSNCPSSDKLPSGAHPVFNRKEFLAFIIPTELVKFPITNAPLAPTTPWYLDPIQLVLLWRILLADSVSPSSCDTHALFCSQSKLLY